MSAFAEVAKPQPVANKSGKTYSRAEVAKVSKTEMMTVPAPATAQF